MKSNGCRGRAHSSCVAPVVEQNRATERRPRLLLLAIFLVSLAVACGRERAPAATMAPPPAPAETAGQAGDAAFLHKSSSQHVRVMSFNPYWDSFFPDDDPLNDPMRRYDRHQAFLRIVAAVQPDVVCLQEVKPERDPQQVADLMEMALPTAGPWTAHSSQDNVIAARFPLQMRDGALIYQGRPISLGHATALVDLPDDAYVADLYLICAHFRSQGGEENIALRQKHADAIVGWLRDARSAGGQVDLPAGTPFVVLGDFNVYDTDPARHLDTLLRGDIVDEQAYGPGTPPDWDGTALADALPRHNASGNETYTWRDDVQPFNPGALDRILYSDSAIAVDHAFVLNTMAMSEAALAQAGLQAADVTLDAQAGTFDHLPLVADMVLLGADGP